MRPRTWVSRTWGLLLVLALFVGGCGERGRTGDTSDTPAITVMADSMTIDRVLRTDDRFSTLVAALDSTNLDSTLSEEGPYTLFAPPDSAFARLPDGTMEVLLTDRPDRLRAILAHHVVEGRVEAGRLADRTVLRTLGGDSLQVRRDSALTVGPATVVDADVAVANGLIHVLDRVLPPPSLDE